MSTVPRNPASTLHPADPSPSWWAWREDAGVLCPTPSRSPLVQSTTCLGLHLVTGSMAHGLAPEDLRSAGGREVPAARAPRPFSAGRTPPMRPAAPSRLQGRAQRLIPALGPPRLRLQLPPARGGSSSGPGTAAARGLRQDRRTDRPPAPVQTRLPFRALRGARGTLGAPQDQASVRPRPTPLHAALAGVPTPLRPRPRAFPPRPHLPRRPRRPPSPGGGARSGYKVFGAGRGCCSRGGRAEPGRTPGWEEEVGPPRKPSPVPCPPQTRRGSGCVLHGTARARPKSDHRTCAPRTGGSGRLAVVRVRGAKRSPRQPRRTQGAEERSGRVAGSWGRKGASQLLSWAIRDARKDSWAPPGGPNVHPHRTLESGNC